MLVLAIDPSGSFYEGKGTTGWALFEAPNRKLVDFGDVKAEDFTTAAEYYTAVGDLINKIDSTSFVVIEEYLLYANKAKQQINSRLETSKLIGYLQMHCCQHNIPYKMQTASEVKTRWADYILVHKKILEQRGEAKNFYYALGRLTNDHERDAMRHAMHFITFKLKKEK